MKLSIELDTATLGDNETLLRIAHALNPAAVGVLGISKIADEAPGQFELTQAAHEYLHRHEPNGVDAFRAQMAAVSGAPLVPELPVVTDGTSHQLQAYAEAAGLDEAYVMEQVSPILACAPTGAPGPAIPGLTPEQAAAHVAAVIDDAFAVSSPLAQPEPAAVEPPKRRAGRKSAAEKAAENPDVAAIREAEKQAMMEAINAIKPVQPAAAPAPLPTPGALPGAGAPLPMPAAVAPPALPVAAAPSLPPLPGMIAPTAAAPSLPPLPTASTPQPALPTAAAAAQTPAIPGAALAMPVIPMDGSVMSEADFITVVRISSQKSTGAAFKILTKYNWFDPKQVPDANRAAVAAEILSEANKAAA